jgi:hypothetical protein
VSEYERELHLISDAYADALDSIGDAERSTLALLRDDRPALVAFVRGKLIEACLLAGREYVDPIIPVLAWAVHWFMVEDITQTEDSTRTVLLAEFKDHTPDLATWRILYANDILDGHIAALILHLAININLSDPLSGPTSAMCLAAALAILRRECVNGE